MSEIPILYKAADYLRISKEDSDFSVSPGKTESNSISSQRALIQSFVQKHSDIVLVREYVDDGYTGTNFDRPDFQNMMKAAERGEINCIIVKDLSRFGREYIDSGKYIEHIFPRIGLRFIAVNDGIDTVNERTAADNLLIPFKNLINDSYSRDISIKIRSSLAIKRQRGEFIANFSSFGYKRDPNDKSRQIVDEAAAEVVRDIFRWEIEGMSPEKIARRLNSLGVLSPSAYKAACGTRYRSGFDLSGRSNWTTQEVIRILKNETYCGVLVQGKRTTPNYKVKKNIIKAPNEWTRVENCHEAIVSAAEYAIVQRLLKEDVRIRGNTEYLRPLSGRVFCGECGARAVRKTVTSDGKRYVYHACPNSCEGGSCQKRSIHEQELENAVLHTIQMQIRLLLEQKELLDHSGTELWDKRELHRTEKAILSVEEAIQRHRSHLTSVYEDYRDGVIDQEEMLQFKGAFQQNILQAEEKLSFLKLRYAEVSEGMMKNRGWLSQLQQYRNITELTRTVVVYLIDKVLLFPEKRIEVLFRFQDQLNDLNGTESVETLISPDTVLAGRES